VVVALANRPMGGTFSRLHLLVVNPTGSRGLGVVLVGRADPNTLSNFSGAWLGSDCDGERGSTDTNQTDLIANIRPPLVTKWPLACEVRGRRGFLHGIVSIHDQIRDQDATGRSGTAGTAETSTA
jgi:hypothetical protein